MSKTIFNRTNESIEWAKWSWNPVVGCRHGCTYCYARDIAVRFMNGFEPRFLPGRLSAPWETPKPKRLDDIGERNVFVCSMADLFGEWVPQEWIDQVLDAVTAAPEWWNFLFLTKNPSRLLEVQWSANCWVGTTVDCQASVQAAQDVFARLQAPVKFLSCEPLREPLLFGNMSMFDWVIIGGQSKSTGDGERQPAWEWVEDLVSQARDSSCKVYFKPNLTVRPKEWPRGREVQHGL